MLKIECLACGKTIKVPQYIDTEKYDGQVVCEECNSLLYLKLVKERVQKYNIAENKRECDITIIHKTAYPKEAEDEEKEEKE